MKTIPLIPLQFKHFFSLYQIRTDTGCVKGNCNNHFTKRPPVLCTLIRHPLFGLRDLELNQIRQFMRLTCKPLHFVVLSPIFLYNPSATPQRGIVDLALGGCIALREGTGVWHRARKRARYSLLDSNQNWHFRRMMFYHWTKRIVDSLCKTLANPVGVGKGCD